MALGDAPGGAGQLALDARHAEWVDNEFSGQRFGDSRRHGNHWGLAPRCRSEGSNRSKRARPPAPAEPRSAARVVGAAGRARSGAERRARTTSIATLPTEQNGTSGVLAYGKHAWRGAVWATPRTVVVGHTRLGWANQVETSARSFFPETGRSWGSSLVNPRVTVQAP